MESTLSRPVADAEGFFYESRVSEALGVPRKIIARLRTQHLREGEDFVRKEANAVALTALGLVRLEAALAPTPAGLPAPVAKETGGKPSPKKNSDVPAGPHPREVMTVERVPQNPQILLCARRKPACTIAVRVKDNATFWPGCEIECIQGGGVWQFRNRAGNSESTCGRLPRRKGVW